MPRTNRHEVKVIAYWTIADRQEDKNPIESFTVLTPQKLVDIRNDRSLPYLAFYDVRGKRIEVSEAIKILRKGERNDKAGRT